MNEFSWFSRPALGYAALALASFHIAYGIPGGAPMLIFFPLALLQLARCQGARPAFYLSLAVGLGCYAPYLAFFYTLFGPTGSVLWLVISFWLALFVSLVRAARIRWGAWGYLLAPILWTGLEYFRSEIYYLKFSWLNLAYAFSDSPPAVLSILGMYGWGAFMTALAAAPFFFSQRRRPWIGLAASLVFCACLTPRPEPSSAPNDSSAIRINGLQWELPSERELFDGLDRLIAREPKTDLIVLSEHTLLEEPTPELRDWVRRHEKYLVLGGRQLLEGKKFLNTAYVIGPDGRVVFQQVKSVPVQMMDDGLPASHQEVWNSPWGPVGIAICYDLSYRRVMDRLVRKGARALIIPTMDAIAWGERQHWLHARVPPIRAAEYQLPLFRLASSGVSMAIDSQGVVLDQTAVPGQGTILLSRLHLSSRGRLPMDRWLAPICCGLTGLYIISLMIIAWWPASLKKVKSSPLVSAPHETEKSVV